MYVYTLLSMCDVKKALEERHKEELSAQLDSHSQELCLLGKLEAGFQVRSMQKRLISENANGQRRERIFREGRERDSGGITL